MNKISSIRFFNDREVRAVWDESQNKWWFSATDIVQAINNEPDYVKAGNYWRWLKKKLKNEGNEVVSVTHDFKFEAPDGKKHAADALDDAGVQMLATNPRLSFGRVLCDCENLRNKKIKNCRDAIVETMCTSSLQRFQFNSHSQCRGNSIQG